MKLSNEDAKKINPKAHKEAYINFLPKSIQKQIKERNLVF